MRKEKVLLVKDFTHTYKCIHQMILYFFLLNSLTSYNEIWIDMNGLFACLLGYLDSTGQFDLT